MHIRKVTAYPLRYPEPNDRMVMRHVTLAKIETDNGLVGWGECISQWPEAALAVKTLIEQGFAPLLIGRDPTENHALYRLIKDHCWWYGDTGMATFAVSAIDIALWDLKGKALGLPIHNLLGGKLHDRLRACASTHPSKAGLDDLAQELADHAQNGYTAVKVGFGKMGEANLGTDEKRDIAYVRAVREAIGPNVDFMVDLGKKTRWDYAMGVRMSREFEQYGLRWIEDPFQPTNIEAYQHLRRSIQTQVAAGEREWTPAAYKRLIELGVADIYLADPGRIGGITAVKEVIEMTAAAHLFYNAHTWSSAINTAAAVHLTATAPNYIVFELKPLPSPLQNELVVMPITQEGGWVPVLNGPGLGIEIREEAVHKYLFDHVV
ncbi:MAG: mandelate racemase/muconate lactonizing enzyme family protein [Anaerolineales bacterium]|nr:mandelate racemase/muconate lactonizing enzyme family protein [Anaerolineales bacterium]